MPSFSNNDFLNFFDSIVNAFSFILHSLSDLLNKISSISFLYIFICLIVMLCISYGVGWLVLEVSGFARVSNPYSVISSKKLGGVSDLFSIAKKVKRSKELQESEAQKINEKLIREHENQLKASAFFDNNPHSYKISIDGKTYWRDDWFNKRWDKDGEIKQVIHYEKDNTGQLKEKYTSYTSRSDYSGKISDVSFDVGRAEKRARRHTVNFGNLKRVGNKYVDVTEDESSDDN